MDSITSAIAFLDDWHVVMVVTFVESYLEDVLADAAGEDPSLMAKSEQAVTYADAVAAESLAALRTEIRHRWSRNFVNDGGPPRWIDRLTRMGASGYERDLGMSLDEFWGMRHMVVHSAGRVTPDFVRRHPSLKRTIGTRLDTTKEQILYYSRQALALVSVTDKFIARRFQRWRCKRLHRQRSHDRQRPLPLGPRDDTSDQRCARHR